MNESAIVAVQLEPCHSNTDGSAWYAYLDGTLDGTLDGVIADLGEEGFQAEIERRVGDSDVPLGVSVDSAYFEEVPTALSKRAGLRRYYVGSAE